jgi:UDP-2-acetamido-3-amino-2,3-dideoxy-glucuronate N-acetyltransferase
VTRDGAPYALMAGVPARRIGWACECGETVRFEGERAACAACGRRYEQTGPEHVRRADAGPAGLPAR